MTSRTRFGWILGAIGLCSCMGSVAVYADEPAPATASHETNCSDKKDDDGDGLVDCADADCKADPACKVGSGPENTDARCSDWFDNDGDGLIDCDDPDCQADNVHVCKGSWKGDVNGPAGATQTPVSDDLPDLKGGMSVEDLIGTNGDIDGERNDEVCADGIDNDGDGKTDCADYGCRFDPDVTVCRGNPGMRFSVVGAVTNSRLESGGQSTFDNGTVQPKYDTTFSKLQLRAFGPIAAVQNSFFLINMRAERTPRLTFAMFQMPLGNSGHTLNLNSGGGGLSAALITSSSKQLLIDPAYYVYNGFEQSNGAAVEAAGPLMAGFRLSYRIFAAGGSGRSTGNIGGVYYTYDNTNYTYGGGAQLIANFIGTWSRFDTPFLYTPVPLTVAATFGIKFDQRAQERYPAANVMGVLRYRRLYFQAETYAKHELEYDFNALAYNVQAGLLAVPKYLLFAADFGEFMASTMQNPHGVLQTDLKKQLDERQWRVAAHYYFWRSVGILTLMYRDHTVAAALGKTDPTHEKEFTLTGQFRF